MNNRLVILLLFLSPLAAHGQTDADSERKMKAIIIPAIEFRQANASDVLNFLVEATTAVDPDKTSFGLIDTNTRTAREYYTYEVEDGIPLELHPLTLEYRRISMYDAIDQITRECGLTYRIGNGSVHFYTQDGKRITRKKHIAQVIPPDDTHGAETTDWGFDGTDSSFGPAQSVPPGER